MTHSTSYMGSIVHGALLLPVHVEKLEPVSFYIQKVRPTKVDARSLPKRAEGDSYINLDLHLAMLQNDPSVWIFHRRAWKASGSASSPCSRTRNNLIQGDFFGRKVILFQTKLCKHPLATDEYQFSYRIRKAIW